jgi:hypothetical protein
MTSPSELPDWVETALNGHSTRVGQEWTHLPGDHIAGEVVRIREGSHGSGRPYKRLTLRVQTGTELEEPVPIGEWRTVSCLASVLREWVDRDQPQVGDRVAVMLRGKTHGHLDYIAGVHRDQVPAGWE